MIRKFRETASNQKIDFSLLWHILRKKARKLNRVDLWIILISHPWVTTQSNYLSVLLCSFHVWWIVSSHFIKQSKSIRLVSFLSGAFLLKNHQTLTNLPRSWKDSAALSITYKMSSKPRSSHWSKQNQVRSKRTCSRYLSRLWIC